MPTVPVGSPSFGGLVAEPACFGWDKPDGVFGLFDNRIFTSHRYDEDVGLLNGSAL